VSKIGTAEATGIGHRFGGQTIAAGRASPQNTLQSVLFWPFDAEMETVLILITLWNLVPYEIANQSHDFCPYSQFRR